jgi:hypothetical protein
MGLPRSSFREKTFELYMLSYMKVAFMGGTPEMSALYMIMPAVKTSNEVTPY